MFEKKKRQKRVALTVKQPIVDTTVYLFADEKQALQMVGKIIQTLTAHTTCKNPVHLYGSSPLHQKLILNGKTTYFDVGEIFEVCNA